ncbi:hypothetical protein [Cupriavidus basilensis]
MRHALVRPEKTQSTFPFSPQGGRFAAEHSDLPQLRWIGDGIGLDASQAARISFLDQVGRVVSLTLAETLARSDEIDDRGLYRILATARCAFEAGDLAETDGHAWQQWERSRAHCEGPISVILELAANGELNLPDAGDLTNEKHGTKEIAFRGSF